MKNKTINAGIVHAFLANMMICSGIMRFTQTISGSVNGWIKLKILSLFAINVMRSTAGYPVICAGAWCGLTK